MVWRWLRLWQKRPRKATGGFRPVSLPPATCAYAIGDVHGRLDLLRDLEARIVADAATRPRTTARHLILLGDYGDRGPDTRGVVDHLLAPPPEGFERTLLLGNHDWWVRRFLDEDGPVLPWIVSGAEALMRSYGLRVDVRPNDAEAVATLRRQLGRRMPPAHRRFFRQLQLWRRLGDYLFVHAGIRPGLPLQVQEPQDLMFIREPFLSDESDHGFVVVHGHTVVDEPIVRGNRIGIDTGAYATGRLTAVAIERDEIRFLSTAE